MEHFFAKGYLTNIEEIRNAAFEIDKSESIFWNMFASLMFDWAGVRNWFEKEDEVVILSEKYDSSDIESFSWTGEPVADLF